MPARRSPGSASEAAPPAKVPVWPVVVTDEPIRLHMERVASTTVLAQVVLTAYFLATVVA